ncbi:MAG: hypothetical protein IJ099_03220 [Alphaproteobacteria bacterium]|nr:hypothetical protein [Alphaproteobacteria bacterium]
MGRYSNCTYFENLYDAVNQIFPAVNRPQACTILRETILAPNDYELEFNNASYNQEQIQRLVARQLLDSCIQDTPEQTFYNVLESAAQIMKHMNDGYITTEDHEERTQYLSYINKQEFVLFAALAFLKSACDGDEKLENELILNIVRLREINDLILQYTRDAVEIEVGRDEFEQAKPIYRMLKSLQSLGYDYNFSPKERAGLGIDHENDNDLSDNFNYEHWLKRLMLLQLRKEIAMDNIDSAVPQNIEAAQEVEEDVSDRIAKLRGMADRRRFDKNRFRQLEESERSGYSNAADTN